MASIAAAGLRGWGEEALDDEGAVENVEREEEGPDDEGAADEVERGDSKGTVDEGVGLVVMVEEEGMGVVVAVEVEGVRRVTAEGGGKLAIEAVLGVEDRETAVDEVGSGGATAGAIVREAAEAAGIAAGAGVETKAVRTDTAGVEEGGQTAAP